MTFITVHEPQSCDMRVYKLTA